MKIAAFIVITILLLGGLFYVFQPKEQQSDESVSSSPSQTTVSVSPSEIQTSDKAVSLVIKNNALVSGENVISVTEGDTVIMSITADTDDELHIHGYDILIPVKKDTLVQHTVEATISGRFPIELHNSETEVVVLEVMPK